MAHKNLFEKLGQSLIDSSTNSLDHSWEKIKQTWKEFETDDSFKYGSDSTSNTLAARFGKKKSNSTGRKRKKTQKHESLVSTIANSSNEREEVNFEIYSDSSEDERLVKKPANTLRNEKDDTFINQYVQSLANRGKKALANKSNITINEENVKELNNNTTNNNSQQSCSSMKTDCHTPTNQSVPRLNFSTEKKFQNESHEISKDSFLFQNETLHITNQENSARNNHLQSSQTSQSALANKLLRKNLFSGRIMHSTPKRDLSNRRIANANTSIIKENEAENSFASGASQYVSQVPSPVKEDESEPKYLNDSRSLFKLSKKLEKEFKKFEKESKKSLFSTSMDKKTGDLKDESFEVKHRFCTQLFESTKSTINERNAWLHSSNSKSKNKQPQEKLRKRLPIRLFNVQRAKFGFVTSHFEIEQSLLTNDVELNAFQEPKIIFPVHLANEMGLTNDMTVELIEPYQISFCSKSKCTYVTNPFWIRVLSRKTSNESNQTVNTTNQTADDSFATHFDRQQLSFETIYSC